MKYRFSVLAALASTTITLPSFAQTQTPLRPGTLLQSDFEGGTNWAGLQTESVGTIDTAGSTAPSLGLKASATLASGPLPVQNTENSLGKLTLAFSLSASAARPVTVRVESFDKNKKRTGGLEKRIYPAAPDFYQRFALDLDSFQPAGAGKFQPNAPFVGFTFSAGGSAWNGVEKPEIRLDNVQYAKPAFYVNPIGSDSNDGRTEKTAFATPQKAIDLAGPGDIILLMNGTYTRSENGSPDDGVVGFRRGGAPAAWITLRNYPGHKPLLTISDSWNILKIGRGSKTELCKEPALAYLEVRGLHLRGEGDIAKEKYPELIGKPNPQTNANGLRVEGRFETEPVHHIRLADNLVECASSHGIFTYDTDWLYVENNTVRNNSWSSIWEGSGLSMFGGRDFDGTRNVYKTLALGNRAYNNRCLVKNAEGRIRNGNGIIFDANNEKPERSYGGRILVQNNLSFNNGGVGIQMWGSHRIDLVHNTVYYNGNSPELNWGQMAATFCNDIRMINNIVVAPPNRPVNTWYGSTESRNTNIMRAHNLYFGGGFAPILGETDRVADPMFMNPSLDPEKADFRLKPESPAIGAARREAFTPLYDIDGKLRPLVGMADAGAYQH